MTSSPAPVTPDTPAQTKYYLKFLDHDRMPAYGGVGQWPAPGVWTEEVEPIPCKQGWHLCRKQDVLDWFNETLWVVEVDGDVVVDPCYNNKVVARRARLVRQVEEWGPRNQRLFAADCAEHVLHPWEAEYPQDTRPRRAIETARRFARGGATKEELDAARYAARYAAWSAWDAAWDAARYAAWSAAWSAERSAAWEAADAAARAAAETASEFFARAATKTAGRNAERIWQTNHLFQCLKLDPNDFH